MKRYFPPPLDLSADPAPRAQAYLDAVRADIAARRLGGARDGARALSDAYDALLRAALKALCPEGDLLLVGVGGYGRREVSPRSDVDLVLVYAEGEAKTAQKAAEALLYFLWDAKLDVGHAIRTPPDWRALLGPVREHRSVAEEGVSGPSASLEPVATRDDAEASTRRAALRPGPEPSLPARSGALEQAPESRDLTAFTSLLDARFCAGSRALWARIKGMREDALAMRDFLPLLAEEREQRRERYGGAVFLLEPELKRGEGGLRDLDLARWAARLAWGAKFSSLRDLAAQKILPSRLVDPLLEARENLLNLRGFLHEVAGRRVDRLTFDKQEEIARLLGQEVEDLMRGYYRWARAISAGVEEIFDRASLPLSPSRKARSEGRGERSEREAEEREDGKHSSLTPHSSALTPHPSGMVSAPKDIDEDFFQEGDRLLLRDDALFLRDPHRLVRAFAVARAQGLRLHPKSRDQIADAVPRLREAVRKGALTNEQGEPWKSFGEILTRSGASELETMHALGVLGALIPEWEPLSGLWLQDLYHVYTVDVHTLHAVKTLRSFFKGAPAFPLEREIARRIEASLPLFLGMLLHDIGKQFGAKEHSLAGARLVPEIATRMGLRPREVEEVAFLVEHHLLLTRLAFRRDTTDPALLSELAKKVGSLRRLRALYLITLADVSAVGPGVLNDWKVRLLRDLYFRTANVIGRGEFLTDPPPLSFSPKIPENIAEAILASRAPAAYLYEPPGELERQIACAAALLEAASFPGRPRLLRNGSSPLGEEPAPRAEISVFVREDQGSSEAIVCAPDARGLLAEIAGVFASAGIDILEARIGSFSFGGMTFILDRFWVRDRTGEAVVEPTRWARTRADLDRVLRGEVSAAQLLEGHSPPVTRMRHEVPDEVNLYLTQERSIVEVYTQDRPGLLYALADAFSSLGLSIKLAKIMTEAGRVADVFYVGEFSGEKLSPARQEETRQKLLAVLG